MAIRYYALTGVEEEKPSGLLKVIDTTDDPDRGDEPAELSVHYLASTGQWVEHPESFGHVFGIGGSVESEVVELAQAKRIAADLAYEGKVNPEGFKDDGMPEPFFVRLWEDYP